MTRESNSVMGGGGGGSGDGSVQGDTGGSSTSGGRRSFRPRGFGSSGQGLFSGAESGGEGGGGEGSGSRAVGGDSFRGTAAGSRRSFGRSGTSANGIQGLFSGEGGGGLLPRVFGSGKGAWRKAAAAAVSAGVFSATGAGAGGSKDNKRRPSQGQAGEVGREEQVWDEDVLEKEEEESEENNPPFLAITVGGVSGFLPDVQWSVQLQQKRFLRVEDSGSIK